MYENEIAGCGMMGCYGIKCVEGLLLYGPLSRYAKLQVRMRGECRER